MDDLSWFDDTTLSDSTRQRLQAIRANFEAMPDDWTCERHGDYPTGRDGPRLQDDTCPACDTEARAIEQAWLTQWRRYENWIAAGIPVRHRNRTLENWRQRAKGDAKILATVRGWLDQLPDGDLGGLILSGGVGLGKTHIGCAIIAEVIQRGATARYCAVPDLLNDLRASYSREAATRPDDVLAPLRDAQLLVLDEIAASRGSDWERETLSTLIDDRYRDGGAVVLLTNAQPADLPQWIGERAADRFNEFGLMLVLKGTSYRTEAPADTQLRAARPAIGQPHHELQIPVTRTGKPTTRTLLRDPRTGRIADAMPTGGRRAL